MSKQANKIMKKNHFVHCVCVCLRVNKLTKPPKNALRNAKIKLKIRDRQTIQKTTNS